ncbi:MAG: amino acid adenylation domain-containing protein, partial [Streptomycetaceae bacterium]|nr:amino acid adenylation domain-containing protein [Streptomycetaceae bacterium]
EAADRPALGAAAHRPEPVPLSFAQQRLWFVDRMEALGATYNIPFAFRLTGTLDRAALAGALDDTVARHESLRTVFPDTDGVPYQRVLAPADGLVPLAVTPAAPVDIDRLLAASAGRGFDLAAELPLRAELFAIGDTEHVLLLVVHHIAADGWSVGPLARDLAAAYAARRDGTTAAAEPLPVQYADYALWQRGMLGDRGEPGSVLSRQLTYWQHALDGLPDHVELPFDRPRPPVAGHAGGHVTLAFDPHTEARIREVARARGVSVHMVLHAGLAALLTRLGAGTDVPIGTPVAGRTDAALDDLVGFFVNTLVLRTDTSGDPTFGELLDRVRETALCAYAHQDAPFEQVVEAVNPVRSLAHHPLFQVMLALQNTPGGGFALPGLTAEPVPVGTATAKFDLFFAVTEGLDDGLRVAVEYRADLFDHTTVEALATRWLRLLDAASADPDRPIGRIDILSAAERRTLLALPAARSAPPETLPGLFEAQVRAVPDLPAVESADGTRTYRELNADANRIAHALIARGIGPDDTVAVALPRGSAPIAALLGILKAGAAYQPIDADHPAARIRLMLTEARPALLVTRSGVLDDDAVAPGDGIATLLLDAAAWAAESCLLPTRNPADNDRCRPLDPRHPAYLIATSGSTGTPKAVAMPGGAVVNLLRWHHDAVGGGAGTRTAQFTAVGFDVSVQEILSAVCHGKTLCVPSEEQRRSAELFAAWLDEQQVAELFAPTLVVEALAEAAGEAGLDLPALRCIAQAGEALRMTAGLRSFVDRVPGRRLHNHYGPAETHVVTAHTVPAGGPAGASLPPIGTPIPGVRAYVLDAGLNPVPPRVPGELFIAGAALARGYVGRAGRTAERFVADPYAPADEPGARMYRTGDLARWNADGELEYLGRGDRQVKVRGFRVELGDIESALSGCPGVAQTAVVPRQIRPGEVQLVAHVVAGAGAVSDGTDTSGDFTDRLRRSLRERLPDYMVPAVFLVHDRPLPLTPNGKLNRAALPQIPAPRPGDADTGPAAPRPPRTPHERLLAELFAEVLGLPERDVDVDADF